MALTSVDFIGHSALLVELDGIRLLTDPVTRSRVGPLRRVEPVPDPHRLAGVDAVLISHLHWDHLDVPSLRDLKSHPPIFVPAGSGAWMRSAGFRDVREIALGDRVDIGGVEVEAVEALHSGFRPPIGPTAPAIGFVMRGRSRSTSPATRTCAGDVVARRHRPRPDPGLGLGPDPGRGLHLDPLKAAEALRRVRPRAAVPIHWGTYWPHAMGRIFPERLVEPPAAFVEYASELAPDVRMLQTAVGDAVALD